jgi:hypothetical protein
VDINKTTVAKLNILKLFFGFKFFNRLVVSGLNHAFHNIDPPAKGAKSKASSMASKLHKMFDAVEEMGAWTEVAGVTAALYRRTFISRAIRFWEGAIGTA